MDRPGALTRKREVCSPETVCFETFINAAARPARVGKRRLNLRKPQLRCEKYSRARRFVGSSAAAGFPE
jgi:hypothetical protein